MDRLLLIIGCAKAGTTSLANWLGQRDDMVLGYRKEPRFFGGFQGQPWSGPASDGFIANMITEPEAYRANFHGLEPGQWAIDGSTDHLWAPGADDRIVRFAETTPVKMICVVRDPVARAISEYNHTLRYEWESLSFTQALEAEPKRRANYWHPLFYHQHRSRFCADIERFHARFGPDQLLILDFDELRAPQVVLDKVAGFLGVPTRALEAAETRNQSFLPRNALMGRLKKSKALAGLARTVLPRGARHRLRGAMMVNSRDKVTVRPEEEAAFRDLISDEIAACLESPVIPTAGWTKALAA